MVLAGKAVRDVTTLKREGGPGENVKALEVYVPLRTRDSTRPVGVFELYQSYAPVAATSVPSSSRSHCPAARRARPALGALFPLVQRMARAVERDRVARHDAEAALEQTSEQLRQAQKMEAIGRLAGGVAHDFNNLLLAINGYADFLVATRSSTSASSASRARSGRPATRAAALTHQLLAFSRKQVLQPRVLDLNESVRGVETMLRRLIGEDVRVVLDLEPSLRPVEADPSQIDQVLLNLAVNARDAMRRSRPALGSRRENDGDDAVAARGLRQRRRHGRGDAGAHLRAVLHDQGDRPGHGARPLDRLRHRHAERRHDLRAHSRRARAPPSRSACR